MIPDQPHSTKSMFLAAAEPGRSCRSAEISQRRRLTSTEAITTANLHCIESGSVSQMAAIQFDASMTFGWFHELFPASEPFFGQPFKIGTARKMETIGRPNFIMKPYNPFELSQILPSTSEPPPGAKRTETFHE
ncbi:hypothetical protein F6V30_12955 [Oryzomonas sagensis]|uniref:Uncharacterized protein n=1 Tax=Oryzomonas sagensis TaxID=2603857 RepID=A0ABQ6TML2_9BACT|nr:hypothetical protein [Oryzomonas sagensis]KAB0669702.1 hypothetical protein F6V30_12955 [Oryzomonas sagensis]